MAKPVSPRFSTSCLPISVCIPLRCVIAAKMWHARGNVLIDAGHVRRKRKSRFILNVVKTKLQSISKFDEHSSACLTRTELGREDGSAQLHRCHKVSNEIETLSFSLSIHMQFFHTIDGAGLIYLLFLGLHSFSCFTPSFTHSFHDHMLDVKLTSFIVLSDDQQHAKQQKVI